MTYWNLEKLSNFKVHELPWMSMNLQCSSIFTIFFIKTKLHLQKAVLKASLFEICYYCWLLWRSEIHRIRKMVNLDTHWIISISLYFGSKIMGSRLLCISRWALMYYYCVSNTLQSIKTVNKMWWYKLLFQSMFLNKI